MSEIPTETTQTQTPRSRRWQFRLRTLFLLVAAIAVWMTYFINLRQNDWLETRIASTRPLTRELVIDDEDQIAVVKLEELWYDENQWDVYLPIGEYRLCLATREIESMGLAPVVKSTPIGAGRHQIALEKKPTINGWRVALTTDRAGRLIVEEPDQWNPGRGSSGGSPISNCKQQSAKEPLILFRRIFTRQDARGQLVSPDGPAEGVLLWIESL
ncbi:hypothetical protein BH23PLA1_BH23PLA1_08540 [soil metagenome]